MEVTVAMLIAAVCITACYTAYGLVSTYYRTFQQKNETAAVVMSLKQVIETDFLKSKGILKSEDGFELLQDSTKISYHFNEGRILRALANIHTDTFKLQFDQLGTYFENQPVVTADTIDQISFTTFLGQRVPVRLQINKHYSAKDLFSSSCQP